MRRSELRERQQPLKERYRDEPEAALIVLRAEGTLGEGVACSVETGRALVEAGVHAGPDQVATRLRLTERHCVVFQTLATTPELTVTAPRPA